LTVRQSDIVNGPAERGVREFMINHAGQWVTADEVRKGTGLAKRVVEDLLLIMALQDEIERQVSAPPDDHTLGECTWKMSEAAAIAGGLR